MYSLPWLIFLIILWSVITLNPSLSITIHLSHHLTLVDLRWQQIPGAPGPPVPGASRGCWAPAPPPAAAGAGRRHRPRSSGSSCSRGSRGSAPASTGGNLWGNLWGTPGNLRETYGETLETWEKTMEKRWKNSWKLKISHFSPELWGGYYENMLNRMCYGKFWYLKESMTFGRNDWFLNVFRHRESSRTGAIFVYIFKTKHNTRQLTPSSELSKTNNKYIILQQPTVIPLGLYYLCAFVHLLYCTLHFWGQRAREKQSWMGKKHWRVNWRFPEMGVTPIFIHVSMDFPV